MNNFETNEKTIFTVTLLLTVIFSNYFIKCETIKLFDEIKEVSFKVLEIQNSSKQTKAYDHSSAYIIKNGCSSKPLSASAAIKPPLNMINTFSANITLRNDSNFNLKFVMEIDFESVQSESNQGYQIRFWDTTKLKTDCIQVVINKTSNIIQQSTHKVKIKRIKFFISLKNPHICEKPNKNFSFYFGKVAITLLSKCNFKEAKSEFCISMGPRPIDIGIMSTNTEIDLAESLKEKDCFDKPIMDTCIRYYKDRSINKTYFIIMHRFIKTMSQVYHQFGISKSFIDPIISYDNETMNGLIIKIVDADINMKYIYYTVKNCLLNLIKGNNDFIFKNYFHAPSKSNECGEQKDFCSCQNKCTECYSPNTPQKFIIKLDLEEKNILGAACKHHPFSALDFSNVKFARNFENIGRIRIYRLNVTQSVDLFFEEFKDSEIVYYEDYETFSGIKSTNENIKEENIKSSRNYLIDGILISSLALILFIGVIVYFCINNKRFTRHIEQNNPDALEKNKRIQNHNFSDEMNRENEIDQESFI